MPPCFTGKSTMSPAAHVVAPLDIRAATSIGMKPRRVCGRLEPRAAQARCGDDAVGFDLAVRCSRSTPSRNERGCAAQQRDPPSSSSCRLLAGRRTPEGLRRCQGELDLLDPVLHRVRRSATRAAAAAARLRPRGRRCNASPVRTTSSSKDSSPRSAPRNVTAPATAGDGSAPTATTESRWISPTDVFAS